MITLKKYSRKEINELFQKNKTRHIEFDVLKLSDFKKMLDEGWVIYDTQITTDPNVKLLTLVKITEQAQ